MEREDDFQQKMIAKFNWPSDEETRAQYLLDKHEEFKKAFIERDIISICKIIESKHVVNIDQDNGTIQKTTQLSLDWLYDWQLFLHIFSDKDFDEEFEKKITHYLSKLYVDFSSDNWKKDRSLQDIDPACILTVVNAFDNLIECYYSQKESSEIFKQRMIFFIDIISKLQEINCLKTDDDFTTQQNLRKNDDEKFKTWFNGEGGAVLPLSPLSHDSFKSPCLFKIDGNKAEVSHEDSPAKALLTPVFQNFGDFIKDEELQKSTGGENMDLDEIKQKFNDLLTGYISFTNKRNETNHAYYYRLKSTDPQKIDKAQTLLEIINSAESLAEIETSVDNYYTQLSKVSSYWAPAANSQFVSTLSQMMRTIQDGKKQPVVEAKQDLSVEHGFS